MSDGKLKYYKKYLKRLTLFANAIGVNIKIQPADDDGIWIPHSKTILVDDDMPQDEEIATILHELGHALDDIVSTNVRNSQIMYNSYRAMYTSKPSKLQRKIVIAAEKKAWKYGRDIAKRLNIRLGKWYTKLEKSCIKDYQS